MRVAGRATFITSRWGAGVQSGRSLVEVPEQAKPLDPGLSVPLNDPPGRNASKSSDSFSEPLRVGHHPHLSAFGRLHEAKGSRRSGCRLVSGSLSAMNGGRR